jgi:hypothetical protein
MKRGETLLDDSKEEKLLGRKDLDRNGGLAKVAADKESDGGLQSSSDSEDEERKDMMIDFEQTWKGTKQTTTAPRKFGSLTQDISRGQP